jgi:methylglutaconyl-CoA hydratase
MRQRCLGAPRPAAEDAPPSKGTTPMSDPVLLSIDARGIATATLNKPAKGNAYDEDLLGALIAGLDKLHDDDSVRALVIRGAGKHFQAGADLDWLDKAATYGPEQAYVASMATTTAMQKLNEFPKPTFALVHGACFGGGCGVVCCVDVAIATPAAIFGLTEVRVGVAPTPISTHMVHAMGLRHTRRYALTGERFGAEEALRIGLVHEVVEADAAEARLAEIIDQTMLSAPTAIAMTKDSFLGANGLKLSAREMSLLAHESWMQRASAEGREGLAAFREKRRPGWYR